MKGGQRYEGRFQVLVTLKDSGLDKAHRFMDLKETKIIISHSNQQCLTYFIVRKNDDDD